MARLTIPLSLSRIYAEGACADSKAESARVRHYQIGPVGITLDCEIRRVLESYHDRYQPYAIARPTSCTFPVSVFARRSWRSGRRHIHIQGDIAEAFTVRREHQVLPHIEAVINLSIARHLPHYIQIHAAVLTRGERALVVAGSPGAGKTTLAAALLTRGWRYATDEFALIDPDTLQVVPYPKTLSIKSGSVEMLRDIGFPIEDEVFHRGDKGPIRCISPLRCRPDAVAETCGIAMVVFPRCEPAVDQPRLAGMSNAEGAFEMSRRCFNFLKYRRLSLETILAATRRAAFFRLESGPLTQTCDLIESAWHETAKRRC